MLRRVDWLLEVREFGEEDVRGDCDSERQRSGVQFRCCAASAKPSETTVFIAQIADKTLSCWYVRMHPMHRCKLLTTMWVVGWQSKEQFLSAWISVSRYHNSAGLDLLLSPNVCATTAYGVSIPFPTLQLLSQQSTPAVTRSRASCCSATCSALRRAAAAGPPPQPRARRAACRLHLACNW